MRYRSFRVLFRTFFERNFEKRRTCYYLFFILFFFFLRILLTQNLFINFTEIILSLKSISYRNVLIELNVVKDAIQGLFDERTTMVDSIGHLRRSRGRICIIVPSCDTGERIITIIVSSTAYGRW